MSWTSFVSERLFGQTLSRSRLERLADELAGHGLEAVWQRTRVRATSMRLSEARGYIRARAAQVIHDQVDAELQGRPESQARYREALIDRATETVISLTIRELVTRPAEHMRPSRAA